MGNNNHRNIGGQISHTSLQGLQKHLPSSIRSPSLSLAPENKSTKKSKKKKSKKNKNTTGTTDHISPDFCSSMGIGANVQKLKVEKNQKEKARYEKAEKRKQIIKNIAKAKLADAQKEISHASINSSTLDLESTRTTVEEDDNDEHLMSMINGGGKIGKKKIKCIEKKKS